VINGVLQIPVQGILLSKFPWQIGRWATGYKYIEMAYRRGLEDFSVRGIALVEDSPGGEVTECFELTDKIYEWRDLKPVRAYAANHAYSAAYSIASAPGPGNLVVTRSGGVGSVGVLTAHVDFSEYLKNEGVKVTFIYAGSHKVDGNPYQKLSDSVKERIQQRIDKIYGVFVSTVARNRDLGEDDVRATEALTYDAEDAIEVGFADRIGELEEELIIYADEVGETGDEYMAIPQGNVTGQKPGADQATGYTEEQMTAAIAAAKAEGKVEGIKEGTAAGATAERERATAIRALPEAEGKPAAVNMLVEMGATVDQSKTQLAKMPAETVAKVEPEKKPEATNNAQTQQQREKSHFDEHMSKTPNPEIGPDKDDDGDKDSATTHMNSIRAATMKATGERPKQAARA
jgi:signal peptide peptidase SppA